MVSQLYTGVRKEDLPLSCAVALLAGLRVKLK